MTEVDVAKARRDTPGCEHVLHFNNAGSALPPKQVVDAVVEHLNLEAEIGGYEAYEKKLEKIEHFYDATAQMLGCKPQEIAFASSATRAWDSLFYSFTFHRGDRILTGRSEYASNFIAFLQTAQKTGVSIEVIGVDEYGRVSIPGLEKMIDSRVKLIAITHVPTNGGLVNPAAEIGRIANAAKIPFLLDACQSMGQMPLNVRDLGCDMLSATGRKFLRGPRGTGLLFIREPLLQQLEPPVLDMYSAEWTAPQKYEMRQDARRFEEWEQYYAGKIGLATAVDYALVWGLENIRNRVFSLAEHLRTSLTKIPGVRVYDLGVEKCGIVTFRREGKDPEKMKEELAAQKINVTVSSPLGTRLDMEARGLERLVRASVHYYNTEDEVGRFCRAISS
ncbi:MAG: aminotransferase [Acidobacteria bacterium]|nr:MAG: aminotransferase [Acidobacteriota bacterium]